MKVVVSGAGKLRSEELIEAANFYAQILMGPKLSKNIKIKIDVKSGLEVLGECGIVGKTHNPRSFRITLRKRGPDIFSTLAHEMVHVKQYARNELGQLWEVEPEGVYCVGKWKGAVWYPNQREDEYYDSPWEIEAHGREVGLYQRWLNHKKR